MKSLEIFSRKLNRAMRKSGTIKEEIVSHINSDTLELIDENPPLLDYLLSESNCILNKLARIFYQFQDGKKYIDGCVLTIQNKLEVHYLSFVNSYLNQYEFELSTKNRALVDACIYDVWFLKINEKKLPFEDEAITEIKELLKSFKSRKNILNEAKLVNQKFEDIKRIKSYTINLPETKITYRINEDLHQNLITRYLSHEPLISYITSVTKWSEEKARKEYSTMIKDFADDISGSFYFQKQILKKLFDILFKETKKKNKRGNKQQVYDFMHAIFEPFYSQLHTEEEHVKTRNFATLDKKTYKQHVRDSIEGLMQ